MADIVMPGQAVAEKPVRMAYTYTDGKKTYATVVSMLSKDGKVIPLEGPYDPLPGDYIVGYVTDVRFANYLIAFGLPYSASLSNRDTREKFVLGDVVLAKIISVDEVKNVDLADARKLEGGKIARISPVKVPRLIGKKNSMISMIAQETGCQMVVGRNGFVFIGHGQFQKLAEEAVRKIELGAHTNGLTDKISQFLKDAKKSN